MSCGFRDCGDPNCEFCTTTARGFPQPPTLLERWANRYAEEAEGKYAENGTKPGRTMRKAAA